VAIDADAGFDLMRWSLKVSPKAAARRRAFVLTINDLSGEKFDEQALKVLAVTLYTPAVFRKS